MRRTILKRTEHSLSQEAHRVTRAACTRTQASLLPCSVMEACGPQVSPQRMRWQLKPAMFMTHMLHISLAFACAHPSHLGACSSVPSKGVLPGA